MRPKASRRSFLTLAGGSLGAVGTLAGSGATSAEPDLSEFVTPEMFGASRDDPAFDNADAIERAFATGRSVRFGRAAYHVARSIGPGHRNSRVHFDSTDIEITRGAEIGNFTECLGWDGNPLRNRDAQGNLPGIADGVRVLFDLTNSRYSHYTGRLTMRGHPKLKGLALLTSSNYLRLEGSSAGGAGSVWDCNLVLAFGTYGMFGAPRFEAPSNEFYPDPFAGSVFGRVWIHSCDMPLYAGQNTLDDVSIDVLHLAMRDGGHSYIFGTTLNVGSIFMRCDGTETSAVGLDVRESTVTAHSVYAENSFDSPIMLRQGGWINAVLRHGAGGNSRFAKGAMVYTDAREAGGMLVAHERCRDSRYMDALVKLAAGSEHDARCFTVHQPYPEAEKAAFAFEAPGRSVSTQDNLFCVAPGGSTRLLFRDGQILRYHRRSGGGPFEPLMENGRPLPQSSYEASYGMAVVRTAGPETQTLFVRYGATEEKGLPVVYSEFRIDAEQPHRMLLSAVEECDLGRQIVISARGAPVTFIADANCRLNAGQEVTLTREGNERLVLSGSEYWTGEEQRYGWVQS